MVVVGSPDPRRHHSSGRLGEGLSDENLTAVMPERCCWTLTHVVKLYKPERQELRAFPQVITVSRGEKGRVSWVLEVNCWHLILRRGQFPERRVPGAGARCASCRPALPPSPAWLARPGPPGWC